MVRITIKCQIQKYKCYCSEN